MFDKLPDLFGKDFVIGYFLPSAIALAVGAAILDAYGLLEPIVRINSRLKFDLLVGTTVFLITAWFGGVTLVALNRSLIRTFEGYGKWNPLRLLKWWQRFHYRRLIKQRDKVNTQYKSYKDKSTVPTKLKSQRTKIAIDLATKYPNEERWLLPTAFGNRIRSFEVYSGVMYGIDAIPCWVHLQAVIPKEYLAAIAEAKAYVDFWLNLGFLALCNTVLYAVLAAPAFGTPSWWIPALWVGAGVVVMALSSYRSRQAAMQWGELVKASFDLFLPDLAAKLGLELPSSREKEREMWNAFTVAVLFNRPGSLPQRKGAKAGASTVSEFSVTVRPVNNDVADAADVAKTSAAESEGAAR